MCNEVFEVVDGHRANGVSLHGGDEERRIAHVPGAGQLRTDSFRRGGQIMFGELLFDPDRQGPFEKSSDHLHVAEVDVRTDFAHGVVPIGIPDQTGPDHVGNDSGHLRGSDPWVANGQPGIVVDRVPTVPVSLPLCHEPVEHDCCVARLEIGVGGKEPG